MTTDQTPAGTLGRDEELGWIAFQAMASYMKRFGLHYSDWAREFALPGVRNKYTAIGVAVAAHVRSDQAAELSQLRELRQLVERITSSGKHVWYGDPVGTLLDWVAAHPALAQRAPGDGETNGEGE